MKEILISVTIVSCTCILGYVYYDNNYKVNTSNISRLTQDSTSFDDYEIHDNAKFNTYYNKTCLTPITDEFDIYNNCNNDKLRITGMFDSSEKFKSSISNYRFGKFESEYINFFADNYRFDGKYVINIMKLSDGNINYCIYGEFLSRQLEYYKPKQFKNVILLNPFFNITCHHAINSEK
jgi:hypothetical protein